MENIRLALTYADVLLIPKRTPLASRADAQLHTRFTRNISLNIPFVSANMATVTEHAMAVQMALHGGLGVLHQFCSVEEQVEEVRKTKKVSGYIVDDPVTIHPDALLKEALNNMDSNDTTSLIVTEKDVVVGLLTKTDYQYMLDTDVSVQELMTPFDQLLVSTTHISLPEAKNLLKRNRAEKIILIDQDTKRLKGLVTAKDIFALESQPQAVRDERGRLLVGAAVGVKGALERAQALVKAGADVIVLDAAHAHSDAVIEQLRRLKQESTVDIMVGNIATADAARDLIEAGADGLKVGIGPSPVCSTRMISGAGVPQLTAIMDVFSVAKKYDIPVCADGGMGSPGDCTKALAAGASTVFSGRFYAGTDEAPGRIILKDGKRYKRYAGSASYDMNHEKKERLEKRTVKEKLNIFVEGVSTLVNYEGPVCDVIASYIKGVQSGMSYCGARTIQEAQKNAEFVRVTAGGLKESETNGTKLSE